MDKCVVDFLAALHKHVWPCLIETLKQMFYDYLTNGKKTMEAEKCQHHSFYGRVLLTQQCTGNEANCQDSSLNESHNLTAEFSMCQHGNGWD